MKKLKAILESVLYIVIIFLTRQVVYYLFSYHIFNNGANQGSALSGQDTLLYIRDASTVYQLVGWLIGTLIILASIKFSKQSVFYKLKIRVSWANLFLSCIIGFGIAFLTNGLVSSFSEIYSVPLQDGIASVYSNSIVITLLIVGVITPIFEEIVYRGIIFDKLLKVGTKGFAIAFQAILFSVSHLSLIQGLYVLPLAVVAGISVYKTKSIGTGIVIHMAFNSFNICLYYYNMNEYYMGQLITLFVLGLILTYFGMDKLTYNIFSRENIG